MASRLRTNPGQETPDKTGNGEADTLVIGPRQAISQRTLEGRYASRPTVASRQRAARISLQKPELSKSQRPKKTSRATVTAPTRPQASRRTRHQLPPTPVKRYLRTPTPSRKGFFPVSANFLHTCRDGSRRRATISPGRRPRRPRTRCAGVPDRARGAGAPAPAKCRRHPRARPASWGAPARNSR